MIERGEHLSSARKSRHAVGVLPTFKLLQHKTPLLRTSAPRLHAHEYVANSTLMLKATNVRLAGRLT